MEFRISLTEKLSTPTIARISDAALDLLQLPAR